MDPPSIPRERWTAHRNFPSQVLLLGSHDNFRRISRLLCSQARARQEHPFIRQLYTRWVSAMRSHEAYEEHKLYPYLAQRWGLSFAAAEAGHIALHGRDAAVREAVASHDASDAAWRRLADALAGHDEALVSHLQIEEDLVIPCLLELAPREFEEFLERPIAQLIAGLRAARPG